MARTSSRHALGATVIGRTLAMATGLIGAICTSQLPEFAQQYRQRLGGAIDELKAVVEQFDRDAAGVGLSRDEAIRRLQAGDDFLRRRGISETQAKIRLDNLLEQRAAMENSGSLGRISAFLTYRDGQLAARTFNDFEPALPVTTEGAAAAGSGFVLGYFLIRMLTAPFGRRRRSRLRQA